MMTKLDVDHLLERAINEHKSGNFVAAELLYKEILDLDPDNIDALHYLGLICMEYQRFDIAKELIARARAGKRDAFLSYNLGLCFQHLEQPDKALSLYYDTISIDPDFAPAHNNIGVYLQQQGKHKEAKDHFTTAIERNPHFTEAHYNYAYNQKFQHFPDLGQLMLTLLQAQETSDDEKRKLSFALGKIYDDIGEYDTAFQHYQVGNQLKNSYFNIDNMRKYTKGLMSFFSQWDRDKILNARHFKHSPIFIVGMPRSGTTLTEQIISAHPDVNAGGESGFIGEFIDKMHDLVEGESVYPNCLDEIETSLLDELLAQQYFEIVQKTPTLNILTDKTPINFLHIGLIKILFPDAKIIHCLRDPMDTCLSCYFQDFRQQHAYAYDLDILGQLYVLHMELMDFWKKNYSDITTVYYEDLVRDPETQARRLIEACELNWSDECLRFYESKREINTASNWQARQPVYTTSVKRWKHYEKYLGELKKALGKYLNYKE